MVGEEEELCLHRILSTLGSNADVFLEIVDFTYRKNYGAYRDYVTPYIQGRHQMKPFRLEQIELEAIRLSDDEILVVARDKFAFGRTGDGGGLMKG